jgi:hypothetical protein
MAIIKKLSIRNRQKKVLEKREQKKGYFAVRDLREKGFFFVDDAFLDGKWMRLLKGCPAAVYFALCRHVDRQQIAFPAVDYIADETGYGVRQVMRAIKTLELHRLVSVERKTGDSNLYSLLNRKHWRKLKWYGVGCCRPATKEERERIEGP